MRLSLGQKTPTYLDFTTRLGLRGSSYTLIKLAAIRKTRPNFSKDNLFHSKERLKILIPNHLKNEDA